jgi:hypothetical protein
MGNSIKDHDPPTGNIIDTAGAVDVAAGGALLVFSELIHNVIGVVLIAFGLFLFYYARKYREDLPDPPAKADRSDMKSAD